MTERATPEYYTGIDLGSTTVKLVCMDKNGLLCFGAYRRHGANIKETLSALLTELKAVIGDQPFYTAITGSGSLAIAKQLAIPFVQEVVAEAGALKRTAPQTDVAIELGGEDAKIIYYTGGLDQRMNGVCAGGTGSFIDQMAALLQTDAPGLNTLAKHAEQIYPIAARCGVFAKSDIQPLINDGARPEDLAASVFQAVVNQTISGLACGKPIRGNVAFLGGPLFFLTELKAAFIRTLHLREAQVISPENAHLFAAFGAALQAEKNGSEPLTATALQEKLTAGGALQFEQKRLAPLFENETEYKTFCDRHAAHTIKKGTLAAYTGPCYLGIDAGSTTTKLALIGKEGELLWSFYDNNYTSPVQTAIRALGLLAPLFPDTAYIARSCSTGYGEALLQTAFHLDEGEVETIAHTKAALFFEPETDCVLDIGGQDMKFIRLKNGSVDTVLLNEACSSGCGSFLENFAVSLGYTVPDFAKAALFSRHPVDLGTRCTVFMNSNVKQAQKEGAGLDDISAGLAYSVIKNALFKVIKLSDADALGRHILVQGGTFYNNAVLRAFEKIAKAEVIRPEISGLMGAFGAALIARANDRDGKSTTLSFDEIAALTYETKTVHCSGCVNRCLLTVNTFSGGRRQISGNRCEKPLGGVAKTVPVPNLMAYKEQRMFDYPPLPAPRAKRGVIGIPRVLNFYENYPFWAVFFRTLGFSVCLSPKSSRTLYEKGMDSIPSESECYPAKLAHGHVQALIDAGITTIFYPSVFYERREPDTQNHFNCPMVIGCPENIKNNMEAVSEGRVRFLHPFISLASQKAAEKRLVLFMKKNFSVPAEEVRSACAAAWKELLAAKEDVRRKGREALDWMAAHHAPGIVLAGRPYHCDPEVHHGIPQMITGYGFAVLTEDSLPPEKPSGKPLRVTNQWSYHARLYQAAAFVRHHRNLELVQLNSFGCGLDAVTTDQVAEILEHSGKLYTLLKIDEINNLGAARIRIRSLIAAIRMREAQKQCPPPDADADADSDAYAYTRTVFTKKMKKAKATILAPQMAPLQFSLLQPVFRRYGYQLVILGNDTRSAVDKGLQCVNNDACYPSLIVTGQLLSAVCSGKYDTDHLALMMTQTGGCCRATNYIAFIRRALDKAGYSNIPVISLNAAGIEHNPGFKIRPSMLKRAIAALVWGDLIMKCLYRMRPYEQTPGAANALKDEWIRRCGQLLSDGRFTLRVYARVCQEIVDAFDALPVDETLQKPRVGIVGEILVKYMPLANNHLVDLLEAEGAEAVVPDLMDFLAYCGFNQQFKHRYLGAKAINEQIGNFFVRLLARLRRPAAKALSASRHFEPACPISTLAEYARPFLSLGNQYGEGWFLAGEMAHLISSGVPNVVCIQPFGCLPNHVVGKGIIKAMHNVYPKANIAAVDYDPGASEVNQLNRIKLMLSAAQEAVREEAEAAPRQTEKPATVPQSI